MIQRIDVAITRADGAWQIAVRAGDTELHRAAADAARAAVLDSAPDHAAIAALRGGHLTAAAARALGEQLFAALLAPTWPAILAGAAATATLIELAIDLDDPGAHPLRAVPWELMASADGWLAAGARLGGRIVDVAITRRTARIAASAPPLVQPLRYLFVIGTELDDAVRAGAECLGLLRQIAPVVQERIVQRQGLADLREVIASFDPHVVHVICHGREHESGAIELQLWDAARGEATYVSAAELSDALIRAVDGGRRAPALAILSACSSGDRLATAGGGDLARALVSAGVPIVVGMAAEIRDQVCRLFARGIGRAFVDRTPLLSAAAQGRRAALAAIVADGSFDWGLVQLLLGKDIDANEAVAIGATDDDEHRVLDWLDGAALPIDVRGEQRTVPPLCGGDAWVDAMYRLMGTSHAALIVQGRPPRDGVRVGTSRAFAELAAAAIRAGHLPIIAMPARAKGIPREPRAVIICLRDAIDAAWSRHGLGPPAPLALDELLGRDDTALTARALLSAVERDAAALRERARALHPFVARAAGRPVLMLHDVHAWGDGVELVLGLLTARGAQLRAIAPTVIAWTLTAPDARDGARRVRDDLLRDTLATARTWVRTLDLQPLAPVDNDRDDLGLAIIPVAAKLALQRVLLHPFRARPPFATRRWFLDLRQPGPILDPTLLQLVVGTDGCCLGQFDDERFVQSLGLVKGKGMFEANDDVLLQNGGEQ